jgi:hypothetical protein
VEFKASGEKGTQECAVGGRSLERCKRGKKQVSFFMVE